jgi:hypothetical protein
MKAKTLLLFLCFGLLQAVNAEGKLKDKIYFGGNIGLSLGSYTQVSATPLVGYKITPKISTGVKVTYEYIKDNRYTPAFSTSNYGGGLFGRYRLTPALYAHAEYDMLSMENYDTYYNLQRDWVPMFLVGGGYSQKISDNAYLNIQVLFDLLQSPKSPYGKGEPLFSVGFGIGF